MMRACNPPQFGAALRQHAQIAEHAPVRGCLAVDSERIGARRGGHAVEAQRAVACVQGNWVMGVAPILIYMAGLIVVSILFKWWHKHPKGVFDESQLEKSRR